MLGTKRLLAALLSLSAGTLLAFPPPVPSPRQFEIEGQFLYLMPTLSGGTQFATLFTANDVHAQSVNNNFGFSPGFRVAAAYGLSPCQEIALTYTWLHATQSEYSPSLSRGSIHS